MSYVDDFFERKRKEYQSATQPTSAFNFTIPTTNPANAFPEGMTGGGSTVGSAPSLPMEPDQKFKDASAYLSKVPEPDLSGKPVSMMNPNSEAYTGEGTTTQSSVPFDLSPVVKYEFEREAKAKELVAGAKDRGIEFVSGLQEDDMALLNMGLQMEKERGNIIRAFDPTIDYPSSDIPYWKDPERLRDVTERRLQMLGQEDRSNYAEEQFRAGARSGITFGYDRELQGAFGAPTQEPPRARGFSEGAANVAGTLVGNIANPITWGIFGVAKAASVPLMGETLAGNIASDTIASGVISGLWNTGETIGSQKDAEARLKSIGEGAAAGLLFSGLLRGAGAGIDLFKGKEVRLTRETGVLKGDDWELQNIRYIPETNSYIVTPEDVAAGRMKWFAEIDATHPDKGRIWDADGFRKLDFQKTPDGISVRTTEWLPQAIKAKIQKSTVADLPGFFQEAGKTPRTTEPTIPEKFTVRNQTIPETVSEVPKNQTIAEVAPERQPNLTTKILEELGNRDTVSKQFVLDLTKRADIKQSERDMVQKLLENEGDKIEVRKFKESVTSELLPLSMKSTSIKDWDTGKETQYQSVTLPPEIRGKISDYRENIYESPVKNSAGDIHFRGQTEGYFGHTRVEDMTDGTRRVIEVQSDLYQRGRTDTMLATDTTPKGFASLKALKELAEIGFGNGLSTKAIFNNVRQARPDLVNELNVNSIDEFTNLIGGESNKILQSDAYKKINQYNNPTAHFRMAREEIAKAKADGIGKVQFPTGDTAMKTEGLNTGGANIWEHYDGSDVASNNIKAGDEISQNRDSTWVITEVIGNGKFKAIEKAMLRQLENQGRMGQKDNYIETFDVSGDIDRNNPIYKFYEKELSKYLKTNYDAKPVTDAQGVTWYEVDLTRVNDSKVTAFQDPTKDYHEAVAKKYGGENMSKSRSAMTGMEKMELLKSLSALDEKVNVEFTDKKLYDDATGKEVIAQFDPRENKITYGTRENRKNTGWHEVVHPFISQVRRLKPDRAKAILDDIIGQYGITEKIAKDQGLTIYGLAEEHLAEGLGYFARNGKFESETMSGRVKQFIKELWERIKGLFGKEDKIYKLYRDILNGRSPTGGYKTRIGKEWEMMEAKYQTVPEGEKMPFDEPGAPKAEPNLVTNPKSDAELIAQLEEMKGGETPKEFRKNNSAAIANTADNLARIFQGNPTIAEVQRFLKGKSPQIMQAAYQYGVKRNMLDVRKVDELVSKVEMGMSAKSVNAKGSGLTSQQKATVISMEGYGSLLRGTEDYKINMTQLSESIKELGARQHFVETPSAERKKIPFTLMGNKAATIQRVIQPLVEQAVALGKTSYVEPFSGAGTSLYILPKLFAAGLGEADLNFFDREKYIVVKSIQDGTINVRESVDRAWNTVIDSIAEDLMKIPSIKEIMDGYGAKPGTPEFYTVAELAFYPQYAKTFFEETPDAKLAKNGEITETFKEWLAQKVMKDQNISEEEARTISAEILSDTGLFEKNYPQISKDISDRLEAFDNIDNVKTVDDALVTTFARHMKQRGTSGQRIVSASNGFQDMFGAYKKTLDGLTNYDGILRKHGDKINIHSMDGKEFIAKMGKEKDLGKTVAYFDPPYVRTTAVYVKNAPEAVKMSLGEYADYGKIPGIFDPLKEATAIYTNDIDGKYYQALGSMYGDRMNKEILGYREGTTPTSVVTTSDLKAKPGDLRLDYYQLVRSNRLRTKMEALSEDLLPMVQDQLKKELAKVIKEVFSENSDIVDRLTKIREGQEKAVMKFEDLKNAIEKATTGRDRQAILREAMRTARDGNITGKGLVAMLRYVNKYWEDRLEAIRDFRERYDKFLKSKSVDVVQKQEYEQKFGELFTTKKLTGANKKEIEAVEKGLAGQPMEKSETELFQKYLMDDEHYRKVNGIRGKKSIYDMDIEEIKQAAEEMKNAIVLASDQLAYRNKLRGDYTDALAERATAEATPLEYHETKGNPDTKPLAERLRNKRKDVGASASKLADYFTGSNWMVNEKLGGQFLKDLIDDGAYEARYSMVKYHDEEAEITGRHKLNKRNFERIAQHSYASEKDGNGARLLSEQLRIDGEDYAITSGEPGKTVPESGIAKRISEYASDDFLTEGEREWYEFSRRAYDAEGQKVQQTNIDTYNRTMGFVEGYTPHYPDYSKSRIPGIADDAMDQQLGVVIRGNLKINTEQGFTIKREGGKFYPMMDARKIFYRHMKDATWYSGIQGPLKIVQEAVKKSENAWGKDGLKFWEAYIDILARNGKMQAVDPFGRIIEKLTGNVTDAVLIANLGSVAKQFSNLAESFGVTGKVPIANMAIVLKGDNWKAIHEKSKMLRFRNFEIMDLNFNTNVEDLVDKVHYAIREKAYLPMQYADLWVGTALWKTVYDDAIGLGMAEADAIRKADNLVKYAVSSPFLEDLPKFVVEYRRGRGRALTAFQTPALNHFSNLRFAGGKEAGMKFGKYGKILATIASTFFLYSMFDVYVSGEWAKLKGNKPGKFATESFNSFVSQLGPLGLLFGKGKFGDMSAKAVFDSASGILKMLESSDDKRASAIYGFLKASLMLVGIPGVANLIQVFKPEAKKAPEPAIRGRFGRIKPSGTTAPKSGRIR